MYDISPYLAGIGAAYLVLLIGSLSPGPAVAMLVAVATRQGRTAALTATFGIAFGSMSINLATLLGVGLVLSQAAWAMTGLRVVGVLYLSYLAWSALRRAGSPFALDATGPAERSLPRRFVEGYLMQVTNPKAIAFWLAIAAIGAVDGAPLGVVFAFVIGGFLLSLLAHGAWAVMLSLRGVRAAYLASRRWVEAGLGAFFAIAALRLATSQR